jgi:hypothetical protein
MKMGVLEDRHAIERMQRKVSGPAHLRFEVPEGVRDILMGKHQPHDLNKGAARKSQYDRIRHGLFLPVSAPLVFAGLTAVEGLRHIDTHVASNFCDDIA